MKTTKTIRCGHCKGTHPSSQDVWECAQEAFEAEDFLAQQEAEIRAEMAWERHLEDRGWEDAEMDRREEMARIF